MHFRISMKVDLIINRAILTISLLSAGLLFADSYKIVQANLRENSGINLRTENIIYQEDFENGLETWTTEDITDPGSFWSTSTFNAYEGTGSSWRMANENILPDGGYEDSWYQVLDTPEILLPASGNLAISFDQFRALEELGSNGEFNGWDGFNVRIRNADQDYIDAEILTDCTPAYNSTSLYGFGFEHNEDPDGIPGIPGWGGSTDWIETSINIPSSYSGSNIIISFAFASDPNTSTVSNPELIGLFIDNIDVAGVFTNYGVDETGFTGFSNTPRGGDLWHISEDQSAPSPFFALGCFDPETLLYNPEMHNYITSDEIDMPISGDIYFDMMIKTELDDNSFPECDYFSVELRYIAAVFPPDTLWSNWNSISNPLGNPEIENVVFTGSVDNWSYFSDNWGSFNDLSLLAGETIQLRVGLHSNDDDPYGFGIIIDDITLSDTTYTEATNDIASPFLPTMSNYPNPFNPETTISLNILEDDSYTLTIYNSKGQLVRSLINGTINKGSIDVNWNGLDEKKNKVSSGVYFYKLESKKLSIFKKMLLMK